MAAVSDGDRGTFHHDGVVCLRGVIDQPTIQRMRAAVDRIGADLTDLSAMAGSTGTGRFRAGTDHWTADADFRWFSLDSILPGLTAAVLASTSLHLYEDSVLVKEPRSAEPTHWHTDEAYFPVAGEQVATVWCPLDPATVETGTLRFVTRSHRWEQRFRPNLFVTTDPVPGFEGEDAPAIPPDHPDVVSFDLEPGDITIHHYRTLHSAPPNASDRPRRAISVRYCGDDATWRWKPGTAPRPHQRDAAEGDPVGPPACPTARLARDR